MKRFAACKSVKLLAIGEDISMDMVDNSEIEKNGIC